MTTLIDLVYALRSGEGLRAVARRMGLSRNTVRKYRAAFAARGLLVSGTEIPDPTVLAAMLPPPPRPAQQVSTVAVHREMVEVLIDQGCEATAIWRRLQEQVGFLGSYEAVKRFVSRIRPRKTEVFCRLEVGPGKEAQVDFGFAGLVPDPQKGRRRKAWAFVMTLSCSRHQFVRFVFDQKMATFLGCHEAAFTWFGGVPEEIRSDNLKAAVLKADLIDPVLSEPFRRLARHYGFRAHPIPPATPRHNGKVESGVHYLKRNFLAGQSFADLASMNERVQTWIREVAGQRKHGTTKEPPLARFERLERSALRPLPSERFDLVRAWRGTAGRDGRVCIDRRFYSVPPEVVDKEVEAYVGQRIVEIFCGGSLVTTHPVVDEVGGSACRPEHLPPETRAILETTPEVCRQKAAAVGTACQRVVEIFLEDPVQNRLSSARCLLNLRDRYSASRLEAACARLLHFGEVSYRRVRDILRAETDLLPLDEPKPASPVSKAYRFVRHAVTFFAQGTEESQ